MEFHQILKHIHMYKISNFNKKLRARGQYYWSYFPFKFLMAFVCVYFLNIWKSHGWNCIKPWKHIYIYNTNIHNKTVRARGQFY